MIDAGFAPTFAFPFVARGVLEHIDRVRDCPR
jgi:hypothetical protein